MKDWGGIEPIVDLDTVISEGVQYTVKEGDELWKIAQSNYNLGETYMWICAATYRWGKNNGKPIDIKNGVLEAGQTIIIPQHYKYNFTIRLVQPGETLWDIAAAVYGYGEVYTQILEWNNWWANTYYTAFYNGAANDYRMQGIEQTALEAYAPLCLRTTDYFDFKVTDGITAESLAETYYGNKSLAYIIEAANQNAGKKIENGKWIVVPIKQLNMFNTYYQGENVYDNYVALESKDKYTDSGFAKNTSNNSTSPTAPRWGVGVQDIDNDAMAKLLNANNLYTRTQLNDRYTKFNRFGYLDPYNALTYTKEYLFFTKPDLHLFGNRSPNLLNEELARFSFFRDALERYPYVMQQLQQRVGSDFPLMPLLSNTVNSALDFPDANAEEMETMTNIYGTRLTYRGSSYKSDEQHQFSLEFKDTKFLEVYMLFKLYDDYEKLKKMGRVSTPDVNYIYRKILYDQFSIYKFVVDEDGETLIYWGKTYGTYPLSVPRGALSDLADNERLKFTVDFKCQFVEDMDPQILVDFNTLMLPHYSGKSDMPLYDKKRNHADGEWAAVPYIAVKTSAESPGLKGMKKKYMLKWRR